MTTQSQQKPGLAIAIDFGTTFSGISYKELSKPQAEPPIQFGSWPGANPNSSNHKVPTILAYPKSLKNEKKGRIRWGFQATSKGLGNNAKDYTICQTFKPHLHALSDEDAITPGLFRSSSLPAGKTVIDATRDYLNLLFLHFVSVVADSSISLVRFQPDVYDYHVLLTVPATFSATAIESFKRVVYQTKIKELSASLQVGTLSEPEAAANYTIYKNLSTANEGLESEGLKDGECFTVCDAGGGTVDVCSYFVSNSKSIPCMLEMAAVAEADYCGSTIIDKRFEDFVRKRIHGYDIPEKPLNDLMNEFVKRKEEFEDSEEEPTQHIGPLPPSLVSRLNGNGIFHSKASKDDNFVAISREQMHQFFEESVKRTIKLLKTHIKKVQSQADREKRKFVFRCVFLVGGLGTSPYFQKRIRAAVSKFTGNDFRKLNIKLITPSVAHLAVVDGGARVMHQQMSPHCTDPVQSKLLPVSYGVVVSKEFDERRDNKDDSFKDPISGKIIIKDRISWFVKKGTRYTGPVFTTATELHTRFKVPKEIFDELVMCDSDDLENLPEKTDGSGIDGVKPVCRVVSDFTQFKKKDFTPLKRKQLGFIRLRSGYEARFTLQMKVQAASLELMTSFKEKGLGEVVEVKWLHLLGLAELPA